LPRSTSSSRRSQERRIFRTAGSRPRSISRSPEKPLLEGEAGVGSDRGGEGDRAGTGARLIRLQCYEGLDAHAVYEWNHARQLLHLRGAGGTVDEGALRPRVSDPATTAGAVEAEELVCAVDRRGRPRLTRSSRRSGRGAVGPDLRFEFARSRRSSAPM
jgi:hypothetical protein